MSFQAIIKYIYIRLFIILFILIPNAQALVYIAGHSGLYIYKSKALSNRSMHPLGIGYGLDIGYRYSFFAVEILMDKISSAEEISKDEQGSAGYDTYHVKSNYYGLAARVYIGRFNIQIGYAFHKSNQFLTYNELYVSPGDSASAYPELGQQNTNGFFVGFGGLTPIIDSVDFFYEVKMLRLFGNHSRFSAIVCGIRYSIAGILD